MSTSIATASLSDVLLSTVPKLNASGSNWAIFVFCFEDAIEAKGFWGHFDGTVSRLVPADVAVPMTTKVAAIAQWDKDKRSAKSLLTQKLPDLTVVMVHGKKMGCHSDGILKEKRLCASGHAGQVYGHEVSG